MRTTRRCTTFFWHCFHCNPLSDQTKKCGPTPSFHQYKGLKNIKRGMTQPVTRLHRFPLLCINTSTSIVCSLPPSTPHSLHTPQESRTIFPNPYPTKSTVYIVHGFLQSPYLIYPIPPSTCIYHQRSTKTKSKHPNPRKTPLHKKRFLYLNIPFHLLEGRNETQVNALPVGEVDFHFATHHIAPSSNQPSSPLVLLGSGLVGAKERGK